MSGVPLLPASVQIGIRGPERKMPGHVCGAVLFHALITPFHTSRETRGRQQEYQPVVIIDVVKLQKYLLLRL